VLVPLFINERPTQPNWAQLYNEASTFSTVYFLDSTMRYEKSNCFVNNGQYFVSRTVKTAYKLNIAHNIKTNSPRKLFKNIQNTFSNNTKRIKNIQIYKNTVIRPKRHLHSFKKHFSFKL